MTRTRPYGTPPYEGVQFVFIRRAHRHPSGVSLVPLSGVDMFTLYPADEPTSRAVRKAIDESRARFAFD